MTMDQYYICNMNKKVLFIFRQKLFYEAFLLRKMTTRTIHKQVTLTGFRGFLSPPSLTSILHKFIYVNSIVDIN